MSEPWKRLRDAVLIQCGHTQPSRVFPLVDRPGSGVVVTRPKSSEIRMLAARADIAGRPLLVDAARYSENSRKRAADPFDQVWLSTQRDAGLPVLTDSGYIGPDDDAGLTAVLARARDIGDCIATLPLHRSWLDRKVGLPRLLARVGEAGVPIAVVLEHRGDPYGTRHVLDGMLELIEVGVPVVQLRCDLSGLGLLCHGALTTAVGTSTSLRHLYPQTRPGRVRSASVATVVRGLLAFVSLDRIATAVRAAPEDSLWTACECPSCNGRQLDQLARLDEPERTDRAFGHALHMLLDLRDGLVPVHAGAAARQRSWRAHCGSALNYHEGLRRGPARWAAPTALRFWHDVPVPVATPRRTHRP